MIPWYGKHVITLLLTTSIATFETTDLRKWIVLL